MKYSFKDITSEEFYKSSLVVLITGQYNIFNNIVIDELRQRCKAEDDYTSDTDTLAEFGISVNTTTKVSVSNTVDFNTFMDVVNMPSINGKWFCRIELNMLTKKQTEVFERYIKNPSKNGILIVVSSEYKEFRNYLKNKVFTLSPNSHLIQLGFPQRSILTSIVTKLFEQRGVKLGGGCTDLFVMRMSSAYEDYETVIDKICLGKNNSTISHEQMQESLKGIENYVIDDLIERLLEPIKTDKISTNRRIYKMLKSLLSEMEPAELVNKIGYKIDDYIEFRIAINVGIIPIKVRYSIVEAKQRLGEQNRLSKIPDFRFRKMAYTASLTSLKDWTYMKMLISNRKSKHDQIASEKVLYTLVHRAILNQNRLNNSLGLENVLESDLNKLNKIQYKLDKLQTEDRTERRANENINCS